MTGRIEDYAIIGNCETAALVGRDGSVDWLCLPRFDSAACFASRLGDPSHGRWLIAPAEKIARVTRRYRASSLILETVFETVQGAVRVTDFMTRSDGTCDPLRRVSGLRGRVTMHSELPVRLDYGSAVPWATRLDDERIKYVVGPDRLILQSEITFSNENMSSLAGFDVEDGEHFDFVLGWSPSFRDAPPEIDVLGALKAADEVWSSWTSRFVGACEWSDVVLRSLITLKALTHFETGGIVAAATTSLPEQLDGGRNWDYRYCWLRDATLTLYALLESNFVEEANAWQRWLLRAVAGERHLDEWQIPWLPGYENAAPVRIGNAASGQVQLDVYDEVMEALHFGRCNGLDADPEMWGEQQEMIAHLQQIWYQPDDGIWEVRGGRQQFTRSKVMAWVAIDRAIRTAEEFRLEGPLAEWRELRDTIHAQVCTQGFNKARNSFAQYYGADEVDANLLMIAMVGFLPASDPRVAGTVAAIEQDLLHDGFVLRDRTERSVDGLAPGEGAFLACSFWLADNYVLLGRINDAPSLFTRLVRLRNDVGLLAEEYGPNSQRQSGNFPQALLHIALINPAYNLARISGPAAKRAQNTETEHAR